MGYKAFVVAVDREACVRYKTELDKYLPKDYSQVIISPGHNDAPELVEHHLANEKEQQIRKDFRDPEKLPKILIVTEKLLTGYDAPPLYCLYLDKPMRDHVLLQAIARVNRPYVDANGIQKRVGLVVDFVGVLRELKKALQFDSSDVGGVIEDLDVLLKDFQQRIAVASKTFLETDSQGTPDERLERLVFSRFLAPESRKAFFESYKEIEALWEILSPSP